ncbi:hypothetical protein WJ02_21515 [Burkholderia vietnamiensis]|nr:hypothetical protein WJ02_21515 [Burkholderia vietnamiensis]
MFVFADDRIESLLTLAFENYRRHLARCGATLFSPCIRQSTGLDALPAEYDFDLTSLGIFRDLDWHHDALIVDVVRHHFVDR